MAMDDAGDVGLAPTKRSRDIFAARYVPNHGCNVETPAHRVERAKSGIVRSTKGENGNTSLRRLKIIFVGNQLKRAKRGYRGKRSPL